MLTFTLSYLLYNAVKESLTDHANMLGMMLANASMLVCVVLGFCLRECGNVAPGLKSSVMRISDAPLVLRYVSGSEAGSQAFALIFLLVWSTGDTG